MQVTEKEYLRVNGEKREVMTCVECHKQKLLFQMAMTAVTAVCHDCFNKQSHFGGKNFDNVSVVMDFYINEKSQDLFTCKHVKEGRWPGSKMLRAAVECECDIVCLECLNEEYRLMRTTAFADGVAP